MKKINRTGACLHASEMKKIITCSAFILFVLLTQAQQQPKQPDNNAAKFPDAGAYANTKLSYKIIDAANHTYGYDVYANDKLMIHQKSIPAISGNEGFKTKADAEKVAQLVISKIKKGEMPPTVSVEEMKKLKRNSEMDAAGSFALQFDGVRQWVSLKYWDMSDLTLESWVKLDSSGSGGPFLNRQEDLMMGVSNGKAYIQLELGGANWRILYSTQTLVPGIWYHVAGTYDHSAIRIYINGQLDGELAATGTLFHDGCTGYWSIGAAYDHCSNHYFSLFAGTVDEIRVWDYARNQSEIQSTLYTSLTGHESGLVGYWPLDEGSGQIAKDQSLHGRDGTLGSGNQIDINDPVWVSRCDSGLTVYADADGDGFGNPSDSTINPTCDLLSGYVLNNTDCNDANASIHALGNFYVDSDGDTYGAGSVQSICYSGIGTPVGYSNNNTDCNDANASVHPNAIEIVGDNIDNNCNGEVDEKLNNALNFDGVNDYVNVNKTLGNFGTGDFTIELQARTSNQSTYQRILSKRAICSHSNFFDLNFSGGKFNVELDESSSATNYLALIGTTIVTDGLWHHLTTTRTSGLVQIYVDGVLEASGSSIANLNNTYSFEIGGSPECSVYFLGDIDEVRIWNVARTKTEIQSDMVGAVCGNTSGLVAYYPFNQGIAGGVNTGVTKANDITANNNNGTLINFALNGTTSNWVTGVPGLSDSATFYQDADGDGYGNAGVTVLAPVCNPPSGYVRNSTDCNDANAFIHPGAKEICGNGIDENCNGQIDEQCLVITAYTTGIKEGDSGITILPFLVLLNAPAIKDCGVKYKTVAGTATEDVDYIKDSGTLHFAPGEISKIIYIQIIGDKIVEPNERFSIRLYNPVNLSIATKSVRGIIANDDSSTNFAASLSSNTGAVNSGKVQANMSVQIMPNPNKGSFSLQMHLPDKAASTTLYLYNNLGAKIWQQDAGILSGSVNRNVALENKLSAGVYVMMIQHGDTRMMQKVFVIK